VIVQVPSKKYQEREPNKTFSGLLYFAINKIKTKKMKSFLSRQFEQRHEMKLILQGNVYWYSTMAGLKSKYMLGFRLPQDGQRSYPQCELC